jgi:hypothetical protein
MNPICLSKMTAKDQFIHICNLTTTVAGLRKGSLSSKSRKLEFQIPRMVASVIARKEEGIHQTVIAEVLKRDRSLIYHYEKKHNDHYAWEKYRDIFNKVYMTYHQIENSKQTFVDRIYMREFLLKNGVKESPKNEAHILIKSDQVGVIIKTSYMDFSNQLENIKLALKNYKYQIEIL